jgi:hypothetical protein
MRRHPGGFLKVAAVGCLVVLVLAGVGGLVAWRWWQENGRTMGADAVNKVAVEAVNASSLEPKDKERILSKVRAWTEDFRTGKIGMEDLGGALQRVAESKVLPVASVMAFQKQYVDPAGVPPEQKEAWILEVHRYARGVYESRIPRESAERVMESISVADGQGGRKLRDNLTPAEVEALVTKFRRESDAALVPREKFQVDIVEELIKAVDGALAAKRK